MREFSVPLPERMRHLPVDKRGFPVPAFVQWLDGEPDFRVVRPDHMVRCVKQHRCWICGETMGAYMCFVIGPMCCVNRITAEPPSHRDCAQFAAKACPFLSRPLAKRPPIDDLREKYGMEPQVAGEMIERNPGVTCIWTTRSYKLMQVANGVLFSLGDPTSLEFYREGRAATRVEIDQSVDSGLPFLMETAHRHNEPVEEIHKARAAFERLLPTYWKHAA